uniref:Ubiquitin-like domain-containing protein n=1 Tax=Aureoumbra lagunensis TaxID=44058 RepID=A0A7S3NPR4_9STRA|mmetsp:Transcript_23431/g.30423  ORF Transcript_23431/g.30423 Transcript_23431/m.30423 type:complete len:114 (-) Transcript_23431:148-489(-)
MTEDTKPTAGGKIHVHLVFKFQTGDDTHLKVTSKTTLLKILRAVGEKKGLSAEAFGETYRILLDGKRVNSKRGALEQSIGDILEDNQVDLSEEEEIQLDCELQQEGGNMNSLI